MAELKTKPTKASALTFVRAIPDPKKRADSLALLKIFAEATGEKPKMWGESIVGYGMYHYKSTRSSQEGDWPLAGFSPRKQNLSLYALTGIEEVDIRPLGKYKRGVSCLYVNTLADIDLKVLKQIVKKSYQTAKKRYKS